MQSVYIPHIPVAYTSEMVTYVFDQLAIGQVSRVDFLAPHETNPRIRQAFVHYNAYHNVITSAMLIKHAINQSYRLVVDNQGHYWDLHENKKPIPETHLNINQLAENMRILQANFESKIAELTEKLAVIPQMQEEIATLKSRIRYLEDPEWLTSTGTGFDNGPLTTSMLNDDIDDSDDEEYDASAAIHPCNASEYAAALHPCDIAFCQDDDDDDDDNHDQCNDSFFSDVITCCTPTYSMEASTDNAANFRAEIENHFVNERAKVAPQPIMRPKSMHCYDEAVDVDVDDGDEDDNDVPTANDEDPFVSIAYADDGRIYVEYE